MYSEDDLLPISALQHLSFCERQCALIHIEQVWDENRLTVEGRILHEKVHGQEAETRDGVRIVRGLRLRSLRLGLAGVADVVEFEMSDQRSQIVRPVEYKRGKPKPGLCDEVQLCAQAMCLEEMLKVAVPAGSLFYGMSRRRHDVTFDKELRAIVRNSAARLHALVESGVTPPADYSKKCKQCSLFGACMPETAGAGKSVTRYLAEAIRE